MHRSCERAPRFARTARAVRLWTLLTAALLAGGCIARDEGVLQRITDREDAGPPPIQFIGDVNAPPPPNELPEQDPHAVRGVDPAHGPFAGGQHGIIRGAGFGSDARVWFGDVEVIATELVAVDPRRIQVTVPPGRAGAVDVTVQNGDDASTRRTLPSGYLYDSFYLEPSTGPVSGGTIVTLFGDSTIWDETTEVFIDQEPCEVLSVRSPPGQPQELDCRTPAGTPGSKAVRVQTSEGSVDVLDAFVYGDTDNGFRGGLSGDPLEDELRVIALDNFTGRAIGGATAIVGETLTSDGVQNADENGVVIFRKAGLGPEQTVTVAAPCYMPITFVGVPVDTVVAYLDPVLSPDCIAEGDPPSVGGSPRAAATVQGELVWRGGVEFTRAGWYNIPLTATDTARHAAYVFEPSTSATTAFRLPNESQAITPDSDGVRGYEFEASAGVGNLTFYALAGIEDRTLSPPLFTAYAMGLVRGVHAEPGSTVGDVYIVMDVPLDHALSLVVEGPTPTPRGPDRVRASAAVRLGHEGYALFPFGQRRALLPVDAPISLVGLPPLVGGLLGTFYVTTASAETGESGSTPRSVIGQLATTITSEAVSLNGFVEVPNLVSPAPNAVWNATEIAVTAPAGGATAELILFEVRSGGSLSTWVIAAPGGAATTTVRLPALGQLPGLGPYPGPVQVEVTRAHIEGLDYGSLRYVELGPRGWQAHATDVFAAHYEPSAP